LNSDSISRILDIFFTSIQPVPVFSFLHRASVLQRHQAGLLDIPLLLTITGLTTSMVDIEYATSEYSSTCMSVAEDLVLRDIEHPSVLKLQALILVIKYKIFIKQFASAFMLFGLAARSAFGLRLNYESPILCFMAQESRRRLMWSIFLMDTRFAGGLRDFQLCSSNSLNIRLPCRERSFELDAPELQPSPDGGTPRPSPQKLGSLALYLQIMMLRAKILSQTKNLPLSRADHVNQVPQLVTVLEADLDSFCNSIPSEYRYTEKTLRLRAFAGKLSRYVVMHIWIHQCYCDLFRIVFPGLREALPTLTIDALQVDFLQSCQAKCVEHARAITGMLGTLMMFEKYLPQFDLDVPICAYQAARMLLYDHRKRSTPSPPDTTTVDIDNCLAFTASLAPRAKAFSSIHLDLQSLVEKGQSSDASLSGSASPKPATSDPESEKPDPRTSQVLSRHNLIRQSGIVDDSDNLGMLPAEQHLAFSLQTPPLTVNETLDAGASSAELSKTSNADGATALSGDAQENAFQCATDIWDPDVEMQPFALDQVDWRQNEDWTDMGWQPYDWNVLSANQTHWI